MFLNGSKMPNSLNLGSFVSSLAVLVSSVVICGCNKPYPLETGLQRSSYELGRQFGEGLRTQSITIDEKAVLAGVGEALAQSPNRLSPADITKAQDQILASMREAQNKNAANTLKQTDLFLQNEAHKPGAQKTPSGMIYVIEKPGSGRSPTVNDRVLINYVGYLKDGAKFDSTVDRQKAEALEMSKAMPGWQEALKMMSPGAKMKIILPPKLAYGTKGHPGIDPNAPLIFELELIRIE